VEIKGSSGEMNESETSQTYMEAPQSMIMMFGIIQCPYCSNLQGFLAGSRTTACTACGRRIDTLKAQVAGPFNDQEEMRKKLWNLKSEKMTEPESNLKEQMILESAKTARNGVLNLSLISEMVLETIREDAKTGEMIFRELEDRGLLMKDVEEALSRLQYSGSIYSPSPGTYKAV